MRVHIHGNCQSHVIASMLLEIFPTWEITYFEVHSESIIERNDEFHRAVQCADVILTQPIHDGYRGRSDLSTESVKAEAKPGSELLVIAGMHFEGHHPGYGHLPGLGELCVDALTAHFVAFGVPPRTVVDLMLSRDLMAPDFVQAEVDASIKEMVRREIIDNIEICLSPFANDFAGANQLFHIVNHPCRRLYCFLINAMLDRLGISGGRVGFTGRDYQSIPHHPMIPSVEAGCAEFGSARFTSSDESEKRVILHGYAPMTPSAHLEKMVAQLTTYSPASIQTAIKASWKSTAFLRRLAESDSGLPGIELWA